MVGGLAAFMLLSPMLVAQSLKIPDEIAVITSAIGQTVNLKCNASKHKNGLFYWYKMNYGYMVETVAGGTFGNVHLYYNFLNSRFQVKDVNALIIRNLSKEDEATYLCHAGSAYNMSFVNGTNLVVNDSQNKKYTSVNQTSYVKVFPGTEVTLHCSLFSEKREKQAHNQCKDEHNVFWFRAKSESNPGFIYTDKIHCSKQERRSCEYRLTKNIQNYSDTGTYYCAVVACGEILFGEGTKVETRQELYLYAMAVVGGLLACSVLLNITLIVKRVKPMQLKRNLKEDTTATTLTELNEDEPCNVQDVEEDGMNYVGLNFSQKPTRWMSKRETTDDCTYSNIKLSVKGSNHK